MRFDPRFSSAYPALTGQLSILLPRIPNVRRTWRAFLKYSGLDERTATEALRLGTDPVFELESGGRFRGSPNDDKDAEFDARTPRQIYLNPETCRAWADDLWDWRYYRHAEATLLHEMCHWGEHRRPGTVTRPRWWNPGRLRAFEEGVAFEVEAYGTRVQRPWTPTTPPAIR